MDSEVIVTNRDCAILILLYFPIKFHMHKGIFCMNEQETAHQNRSEQTETVQNNTLQDQLDLSRAQAAQWQEKYSRLFADFQNFQKRLEREYAALKRSVQKDLLLDLLSVIDNIDRALEVKTEAQDWRAGIELVRKETLKVLQKHGVEEMQVQKTFNPTVHESIMFVQSAEHQAGEVVAVLEKGYMFGDMVLRPAKVSVAQ